MRITPASHVWRRRPCGGRAGRCAGVRAGKTITLSMLAGYKEDVLRANLPEFEKTTGIKVVIDAAPFGDLLQEAARLLSTGGRYDVPVHGRAVAIRRCRSFSLPLNERMKTLDMADFVPTTVASGAFQGTQYAVPVDPNVQLLVYRKDLFDQKGLKPPATWDELLADAKALHDPAKQQYGIAITASSDIQTALYMLLAMWSYGAELVDGGKGSLNSAAGKKGGEVFLELLKYTPPNVKSYNFADVNKAIQLGQAAMAIQWASGAKPMEDKTRSSVAGKLGYAPGAESGPADPDARRVDDRDRQEQREPGRGLAVRHVAVRARVRAGGGDVSERHLRDPQSALLRAQGPPARRRHCRMPIRCSLSLQITKERPRLREYADIQENLRVTAGRLTAGELTLEAALKEIDAGTNRILGK